MLERRSSSLVLCTLLAFTVSASAQNCGAILSQEIWRTFDQSADLTTGSEFANGHAVNARGVRRSQLRAFP
jgi:hypothetical protein